VAFICPNPMCKTDVEVGVDASFFFPRG